MNVMTFDQYLQELKPAVKTNVYAAQELATHEAIAAELGGSLESCCIVADELRVGAYPDLLAACGSYKQFSEVEGVYYELRHFNGFGIVTADPCGGAFASPTSTLVWNSEKWSEDDLLVGEYLV